jgi:hypothetical protein
MSKEGESVIKIMPIKKNQGPDDFIGKFHQTFLNKLMSFLFKNFENTEELGNTSKLIE